ncbi:hypothetical protein P43SY_010821 [Pythium insidiosum]|uniref:Transmembrane protein n=1 Tax=Pythium insidiosum TaxID=114742 RepID=A0AAD5M073_PYTIN|nr:hypothetical protein P43SY_010821 [Pythium insidiosum]
MRPSTRFGIRIVAIATVVALAAGCVLSLIALFDDKWRVTEGLENEQVALTAIFEGLGLGNYGTCVRLRRFVNDTNTWTPRETCYRTFLIEGAHPTTVLDLHTGQQLILNPVCDADKAWIAEKLGIPKRLDIVSLWNKQCAGYQWVVTLCEIFAIIGAICVGYMTVLAAGMDTVYIYCTVGEHVLAPAIPLLLHTIPTFVWLFAMDLSDLRMDQGLLFALIFEGILAWTWLLNTLLCFYSWMCGDDTVAAAATEYPAEYEAKSWHEAIATAKTRKVCYTTLPQARSKSDVKSVVTNSSMTLDGVCSQDELRDVARHLGVPDRLPIADLWAHQCNGVHWLNVFAQVVAAIAVVVLELLCFYRNSVPLMLAEHELLPWLHGTAPTALVLLLAVVLLLWGFLIKEPGFTLTTSFWMALVAWTMYLVGFVAITARTAFLRRTISFKTSSDINSGSVQP